MRNIDHIRKKFDSYQSMTVGSTPNTIGRKVASNNDLYSIVTDALAELRGTEDWVTIAELMEISDQLELDKRTSLDLLEAVRSEDLQFVSIGELTQNRISLEELFSQQGHKLSAFQMGTTASSHQGALGAGHPSTLDAIESAIEKDASKTSASYDDDVWPAGTQVYVDFPSGERVECVLNEDLNGMLMDQVEVMADDGIYTVDASRIEWADDITFESSKTAGEEIQKGDLVILENRPPNTPDGYYRVLDTDVTLYGEPAYSVKIETPEGFQQFNVLKSDAIKVFSSKTAYFDQGEVVDTPQGLGEIIDLDHVTDDGEEYYVVDLENSPGEPYVFSQMELRKSSSKTAGQLTEGDWDDLRSLVTSIDAAQTSISTAGFWTALEIGDESGAIEELMQFLNYEEATPFTQDILEFLSMLAIRPASSKTADAGHEVGDEIRVLDPGMAPVSRGSLGEVIAVEDAFGTPCYRVKLTDGGEFLCYGDEIEKVSSKLALNWDEMYNDDDVRRELPIGTKVQRQDGNWNSGNSPVGVVIDYVIDEFEDPGQQLGGIKVQWSGEVGEAGRLVDSDNIGTYYPHNLIVVASKEAARPTDPYDLAELIIDENPGLEEIAEEVGQSLEDAALEMAFQELANRGIEASKTAGERIRVERDGSPLIQGWAYDDGTDTARVRWDGEILQVKVDWNDLRVIDDISSESKTSGYDGLDDDDKSRALEQLNWTQEEDGWWYAPEYDSSWQYTNDAYEWAVGNGLIKESKTAHKFQVGDQFYDGTDIDENGVVTPYPDANTGTVTEVDDDGFVVDWGEADQSYTWSDAENGDEWLKVSKEASDEDKKSTINCPNCDAEMQVGSFCPECNYRDPATTKSASFEVGDRVALEVQDYNSDGGLGSKTYEGTVIEGGENVVMVQFDEAELTENINNEPEEVDVDALYKISKTSDWVKPTNWAGAKVRINSNTIQSMRNDSEMDQSLVSLIASQPECVVEDAPWDGIYGVTATDGSWTFAFGNPTSDFTLVSESKTAATEILWQCPADSNHDEVWLPIEATDSTSQSYVGTPCCQYCGAVMIDVEDRETEDLDALSSLMNHREV